MTSLGYRLTYDGLLAAGFVAKYFGTGTSNSDPKCRTDGTNVRLRGLLAPAQINLVSNGALQSRWPVRISGLNRSRGRVLRCRLECSS